MQQEEFKMGEPKDQQPTDFANIAGSRVVLEQKKQGLIRKIIPPIIMISAFSGILLLGWLAYKDSLNTTTNPDEVPTIKADEDAIKTEPSPEDSATVPNIDKKVYDAISVTENNRADEKAAEILENRPEQKIEEPIDRAIIAAKKEADEKAAEMETVKREAVEPSSVKTEEIKEEKPFEEKKPEELVKKEVLEKEKEAAPVVAAPKEEAKEVQKPAAKEKKPAEKKKPVAAKTFKVQLGSYKSETEAREVWQKIVKTNPDAFSEKTAKIEKADLKDKGVFFRLRTGAFANSQAAKDFCKKVTAKNKNQGCIVVSK